MPETAPAPRPLVERKDAVVLALGALLGSGGASAYFSPDAINSIPPFRFEIEGTFHLLAVAVAIGTVVGLAYSFYHNNWSLPLPKPVIDKDKCTLSLPRWGFLDEVLFAVVFAVAAVWAKFPNAPPHIFTEATLALAVGAAVAGARMRAGYADRDVLRDALATTVGQPAAPDRKAAVERAATNIDAARVAVGDVTVQLPAALLNLFDEPRVKERLTAHGKPISADGDGLTLETLAQHSVLQSGLKPFVKDMRLPEVAKMSEADFLTAVANNGVDVVAFKPALVAVHKAAGDVMKALQTQPPDWKLGG